MHMLDSVVTEYCISNYLMILFRANTTYPAGKKTSGETADIGSGEEPLERLQQTEDSVQPVLT
jgi:hypothetical protein